MALRQPVLICPVCTGGKFRRKRPPSRGDKYVWVCAVCDPPEARKAWRCPNCRCDRGALISYEGISFRQCRQCAHMAKA